MEHTFGKDGEKASRVEEVVSVQRRENYLD